MNMYYIALVAPGEIDSNVLKWKMFMKENFGTVIALRSPAHITLVPPFWMRPEMEIPLKKSIDIFTKGKKALTIQLRDFATFPPRVLYINVVINDLLEKLKTDLEDLLAGTGMFPVKKDDRPFHPHVTIATRDLYKKDFNKAREIFSGEKFEADWKADGISLLRNGQKKWEVIFTSRFD